MIVYLFDVKAESNELPVFIFRSITEFLVWIDVEVDLNGRGTSNFLTVRVIFVLVDIIAFPAANKNQQMNTDTFKTLN